MKVWCNAEFPSDALKQLEEGLSGHELVFAHSVANNLSAGGFSPELEGAQVAFGQPDPHQCMTLKTLKLVQITSAGYTRYDNDPFRKFVQEHKIAFSNSSSVYDEPCAQHILAFMLARARQLPASIVEQARGTGWNFDRFRPLTKCLRQETVLIVGYGAIGKRLVQLLSPFDLRVISLRRTPSPTDDGEVHAISELSRFLPEADHIVNILPANESTNQFFNHSQFAEAKPGATFYNIGRGTTVDQTALIESLQSGHLAAALLDVTDPEPLPREHPLWKAPNCTITPHIAGGFVGEQTVLVNHFLNNLKRFESGSDLIDRVF